MAKKKKAAIRDADFVVAMFRAYDEGESLKLSAWAGDRATELDQIQKALEHEKAGHPRRYDNWFSLLRKKVGAADAAINGILEVLDDRPPGVGGDEKMRRKTKAAKKKQARLRKK